MLALSLSCLVLAASVCATPSARLENVQSVVQQALEGVDEITGYITRSANGDYSWTDEEPEDALVKAGFKDNLFVTGWGELRIKALSDELAHPALTNSLADYEASGFAEGYLTAHHTYNQYRNLLVVMAEGKIAPNIEKWFGQQLTWSRKMCRTKAKSDNLWRHTAMILAQLDGFTKGFNRKAALSDGAIPAMTEVEILWLNSIGDVLDLHVADKNIDERPQWHTYDSEAFANAILNTTHCSALIKPTADYSDLYISHSSWFSYSATNRIYKHYNFGTRKGGSATKMSFSSYAGQISSLDDFYIMDNGLVMTQTTNNVFNNELFDLVHPESLLAWQRVRLANQVAENGKQWSQTIEWHNSGTYNNQYMVVDLNKFKPKEELQDGLLWVSEQIPGHVSYADVTNVLRDSHWPSYNVPYFKDVYAKSGYPAVVEQRGFEYSYQMAPRATIFRRDGGKVQDLDGMEHLMRFNEYETDPLSLHDPSNSICSRPDLRIEGKGVTMGCYDTKVTSATLAKDMIASAINGPTHGTKNSLPTFTWEGEWNSEPHYGLPEKYNFDFVDMDPKWTEF